ncbi:MAG: hypothetical protein FD174_1673 [Geobacteraceae bacterium]|nr:MAG: hypothetical protein FD174_1673 [Geobacteraceae bacterium]
MKSCKNLDPSQAAGQFIYVFRREVVTEYNFEKFGGIVPLDQREAIEAGDVISVIYFDNKTDVIRGTITIWHNKSMAAIHRGGESIWGDWDESAELVVTEEYEETWNSHGEEISGRIAYNSYGVEGILSCGEFYTDCENRSMAGHYRLHPG